MPLASQVFESNLKSKILASSYRRISEYGLLQRQADALKNFLLQQVYSRGTYSGKKFAIITEGRSGSSLLCDLLDQHPYIRCQSEILTDAVKDPLAFAQGSAAYFKEAKAYGFKFKPSQVRNGNESLAALEHFLLALSEHRWEIYGLVRDNSLLCAISSLTAWKRGNLYHNTSDSNPLLGPKISLEPERVERKTREVVSENQTIRALCKKFARRTFVYEQNLATTQQQLKTYSLVFNDLELTPSSVTSEFRPISTGDPGMHISNWTQICEHLSQTDLSHFLEYDRP